MDEYYVNNSAGQNPENGNNTDRTAGINNGESQLFGSNQNQSQQNANTYGAVYTPSDKMDGEYHFRPYTGNQESPFRDPPMPPRNGQFGQYGQGGGKPPKKKSGIGKVIAVTLAILIVIGASSAAAVGIIKFAADQFGGSNPSNTSQVAGEDEQTKAPVDYSDTKIKQSDGTDSSGIDVSGLVEKVQRGEKLTLEEAVALVKDSVVEIQTEVAGYSAWYGSYVQSGAGSGVIISKDGKIITNHHVIDSASKITVRLNDGTQFEATLIASDEEADIAVLSIDPGDKELCAATFGKSENLNLGQSIFVIGNPLGELGGSVSAGIISATKREIAVDEIGSMTLVQTDAAVNPGNSGGGLFNLYGELVGVINSKYSETGVEGLGFAIPADDALVVATDLMQYGYVKGRIVKGLKGLTLQDETARYSYSTGSVVVVSAVEGDSKFKVGDIITSVNGIEVDSVSDVKRILRSLETGSTVKVYVTRQVKNGPFTNQQSGYLDAEVYEVEQSLLD